jgi:uncharacterized protein YheU (UPF0270 family)
MATKRSDRRRMRSRGVRASCPSVALAIPHTLLTPETLRRLAEEFVTRDGTDYGPVERTLDEKVAALIDQLERGAALIVYDRESASATIVPRGSLG